MSGRPPRQSVADRISQLDLSGKRWMHEQKYAHAVQCSTLFPASDVTNTSKGQRRTKSASDEAQTGTISPFAGGKAFPANMDAETMTLAAGKPLHTTCVLLIVATIGLLVSAVQKLVMQELSQQCWLQMPLEEMLPSPQKW